MEGNASFTLNAITTTVHAVFIVGTMILQLFPKKKNWNLTNVRQNCLDLIYHCTGNMNSSLLVRDLRNTNGLFAC